MSVTTTTNNGYIIAFDDHTCTIICDYDNKVYTLPLIDHVLPSGITKLSSKVTCDVFTSAIVGKKLISACRAYKYDYLRGARTNEKNREKKAETVKAEQDAKKKDELVKQIKEELVDQIKEDDDDYFEKAEKKQKARRNEKMENLKSKLEALEKDDVKPTVKAKAE